MAARIIFHGILGRWYIIVLNYLRIKGNTGKLPLAKMADLHASREACGTVKISLYRVGLSDNVDILVVYWKVEVHSKLWLKEHCGCAPRPVPRDRQTWKSLIEVLDIR